jgi:hypothetical protein
MGVGMVIFHILFISACVGASWYAGYRAAPRWACVGASWYAGYHAGRADALNKKEKIALDN